MPCGCIVPAIISVPAAASFLAPFSVITSAITMSLLIKSIIDLKIEYQQLISMTVGDNVIHKIEVGIRDENGRTIGFERTGNKTYRLLVDSRGLNSIQREKQREILQRLSQRYSYRIAISQLKQKGYIIVEEKKEGKDIRVIARKWSPDKHEVELIVSEEGRMKFRIKDLKAAQCFKALEALVKEIGPLTEGYCDSHEQIGNPKVNRVGK